MKDLFSPQDWVIDWSILVQSLIALTIGLAAAYALYRLTYALVDKLVSRSQNEADDLILDRIRKPIKWSFMAIGVTVAAQANAELARFWEPLAQFLRPALLGWIVYNLVKALTAVLELRMGAADDPVAMRSGPDRADADWRSGGGRWPYGPRGGNPHELRHGADMG